MAQANGHAFGRTGHDAELATANDATVAECTARVDQLLSRHKELSQQQKSCDDELQALSRQAAELRSTIRDLEQPLHDADAVTLSEAELAPLQALESDDAEQDGTGPCDMDAEDVPSCSPEPRQSQQSLGDVPMDCSDDRLQPPADAAQQDPLRLQQDTPHEDRQGPQVFGKVPAFAPLPDDPTVAMILSCNRYTSSVSHFETVQHMGGLHQAVQSAQHYSSGRNHVLHMKPITGALWSLPVVQKTIAQHTEQASALVECLGALQRSQAQEADERAAGLAVQLAPQPAAVGHDESGPVRVAVRDHMHNFSCHLPAQLDELGRWRSTFVDANRLVADPKQELVLPKFTRPWTKQEKDAMENVLGESGKKFAEVASKVGTRNIAECIDRYYKIHLRDEFKPTWRKMARLKRAADGRNKRNEESKVLATVTKVARHRYDSLPRQELAPAGAWKFPPVSTERLKLLQPVTARDFDNTTTTPSPFPLASEDSLRGHSKSNGRRRVGCSPVLPLVTHAGLDDIAEPMGLSPSGDMNFGGLGGMNHLPGPSASLPVGASLGPPLAGFPPLSPSASLLPLPTVPSHSKQAFQKGKGSVQPSLKFQMNPATTPMLRPGANGNMGHAGSLHGGQLQNVVPGANKANMHAQPEEENDANAEHWQRNPPTC